MHLIHRLPMLQWARGYGGALLSADLLAAVIVTIMLIPQSLAYAMLANLPPEVGLYASILPLVAYAVFGTSRVLAVGPVAVVSLMTASAIGPVVQAGLADALSAAVALALLSGAMLVAAGIFRLGFLANFLSHPVMSGFITASGILIAAGQIRHLLGLGGGGSTLPEILPALFAGLPRTNPWTLAIGAGSLAFLYAARRWGRRGLVRAGLPGWLADMLARAAPILAIAVSIALAKALDLGGRGVALVGAIPQGLPGLSLPIPSLDLLAALAPAALLISVVGFVESVSVGQTLAARRRERIAPDQELIGLGAANIAAGLSAGYPVTGGFARSVVNYDAGAQTPAAGVFTAIGIALAALFLTPLLADLPQAVLAATIILAVLSLVDFPAIRRVLDYSPRDFLAMAATILVTLLVGVEPGISAGVLLSLVMQLYRSSRPHSAVVGQVPGTEHFRNVDRHRVLIWPEILSLRVDESLYFANSRFLEDRIAALVADRPRLRHVVLMCPAVNDIDASALESLEEINRRLAEGGIKLHLSEVKGPVMDRLRRSDFMRHLSGQVFLSQHEAICQLRRDLGPDAGPAQETGLACYGDAARLLRGG
ncbi:SulP family inorganic anion transporter [Paracoccus sp. P2]|uniref:SulP family inorganic anion transporter n=1 Tax=Paracoccus TaxID=265 RepID=UPI0004B8C636|nr:sulfate permease [Paracoccus pantotrophus]MDF3855723.1 sulfate permease [Paracoccus pantotrophus]RDD92565.1 STAS domain-containing protein [Paracoccus pantotrophus]RNI13900.1 sulfate permease [Paracoccus pantotrophus]RNI16412.1 sulfate permease [Paracoccus pantotrophus]WGR66718.1 sulfate permease [Paracoccus pantotrophus]